MAEILAYLSSEDGATAAEYALIIAIVGGGIILAAMSLGSSVGASMNDMAECMTTSGASCP